MTDPTKGSASVQQRYFGKQLPDIDLEIARQAMACEIPLTDRSLILRALNNDATVCGRQNPKAFEKLRGLLTMHMGVREGDREHGAGGSAHDDRGNFGWAPPSPRYAGEVSTLTTVRG